MKLNFFICFLIDWSCNPIALTSQPSHVYSSFYSLPSIIKEKEKQVHFVLTNWSVVKFLDASQPTPSQGG